MSEERRPETAVDDHILFLREFLRNPLQVASIIPSSRFLERRIVRLAAISATRSVVVELGAGIGGTTRAILRALPGEARLLSIEINPRFCSLLRRIDDERLIVHCGSAHDLDETLSLYGLPAPEAIVSGIPFSTLGEPAAPRILEAISVSLAPNGRFVAYQVSGKVDDLSRPLLGPARVELELLNIPPMRLFRWEKQDSATALH